MTAAHKFCQNVERLSILGGFWRSILQVSCAKYLDLDKGSKVRKAASIQDFGGDEDEDEEVGDDEGADAVEASNNDGSQASVEAAPVDEGELEAPEPTAEDDDS